MSSFELATFGAGCFWCTEAVFQQLKGIERVVSGYAGGNVTNPSYKQVCSNCTGHAEAIQVTYDPSVISYEQLLDVFFHTHNPTTLDRQGNDIGSQYRSVIFYHNATQRQQAEEMKKKLDALGEFDKPIVTAILPFTNFYPAEDYHQSYYQANPTQPYCQAIISPKLTKFKQRYSALLKK